MAKLDDLRGRQDPAMTFAFEARITGPGGDYEPLEIEDVILPFGSIRAEPVFRNGKNYYYAKMYDISTVSVRFYEDVEMKVTKKLAAWKKIIKNERGDYGVKSDYEAVLTLTTKKYPTNETGTVFKIKGLFPVSTESYQYQSAQSERLIVSQEFSCDDIEIS